MFQLILTSFSALGTNIPFAGEVLHPVRESAELVTVSHYERFGLSWTNADFTTRFSANGGWKVFGSTTASSLPRTQRKLRGGWNKVGGTNGRS